MAKNQAIFRKIEQDHCFIIEHVDKQSTVLLQKSWRRSFFLPFVSPTHENTYIAGYLLTTDDEYSVHHDHIGVVLQCVE